MEDFAQLIEPLARHFFGEPNRHLSSKAELRFGKHGSLSVDLKKGTWFDHEAMAGGGALDLVKRQNSFTETREAMAWLEAGGWIGPTRANGNGHDKSRQRRIVAHYDYVDEAGELLLQVVRYEPKDFRQRRPDGRDGWVWSAKDVRPVPYHLPELLETLANESPVFIVEGEKDADNLRRIGVPATCNAMGAGKWPSEINPIFAGADVIIIADNDPQQTDKAGKPLFHEDGRPRHAGQDHANAVAAELSTVAARVRVLDLGKAWQGCPEKGDISDWIAAGGDAELLYRWVETLQDWHPPTAVSIVSLVKPFPIDGETIPRRQWIIPGLLLRRYLTVLVAPPGIGKSLLTLQIGMAVSAGVAWAGWRPRHAARVLFINSEDDDEEMRRRLYGAQQIMGFTAEQLSSIHYATQPDTIVIAKADSRTKTVTRTPMAEAIIATVIDNQIDVLIVDPFAETFEGDENSNSELKWAAALWREIARRTNAAVLLVHHMRKFGAEAGSMDSARGGSALAGVARIVSTLFPMSEKEAENMLKEPEKRSSYLRFDDAKANLTLITGAARWFEKKTYTLPNGGDGEPPDDVGVLSPWSPPNVFDQMDVVTANRILDAIEEGRFDSDGKPTGEPYGPSNRGKDNSRWAGLMVKTVLYCDDNEAAKVIKKWIKNGVLEVYEGHVASRRKNGPCVRVVASRRPGCTTETGSSMNWVVGGEDENAT